MIGYAKLTYTVAFLIIVPSCTSVPNPPDRLSLPSFIDSAVNPDDQIVDCSELGDYLYDNDFSQSCIKVVAADPEQKREKFEFYFSNLEQDGWNNQGDFRPLYETRESRNRHLILTKKFPSLGGHKELFYSSSEYPDPKHSLLIFQLGNYVVGTPYSNGQSDQKR